MKDKFVVWFSEVDKEDIPLVGGKGANLGEMVKMGLPVPSGFIVTSQAYYQFLEEAKLKPRIKEYLKDLNCQDPRALERVSRVIKKDIIRSPIPFEIAKKIMESYFALSRLHGKDDSSSGLVKKIKNGIKSLVNEPLVAVRSSATAEDLPTASFAGQQETFLNIKGEANVVEAVRNCWASLFEPRAIFYREENKFDHFKIGIAVPIQKMVQSEASGVMFTIDPVINEKNKIVIEAIWGLGELIVQGKVTPDHYEVDKKTLEILKKEVNEQKIMLCKRGTVDREVKVSRRMTNRQKITDGQIKELAELGKKIERHYYYPQDIEWAIEDAKIYILQTRPVTTVKKSEDRRQKTEETEVILHRLSLTPILVGTGASPGIASGKVIILHGAREISKVSHGDVLVAPQTNPDYVPAMKKVVAIVTEQGGRTSHAAIVSRELGLPCVVGAEKATKILKNNLVVTVNGGTGEVFKGGMPQISNQFQTSRLRQGFSGQANIKKTENEILKTATKLYVNLAQPSRAVEVSKLNVDGVGLLRAEFMIAEIGRHPKLFIKERKQKIFVEKLSAQISLISAAFNPRPVIYRTTDFKTNEYRNLVGGSSFEPQEVNPMLGFRGAFRYITDPEVFELELEAVKTVRNKMGLKNLWLMIPFVRTPKELLEVKKIVASVGLIRSSTFKLWLMVEIPSNVILLEKFIEVGIDGVSIGSNDLTMLILGVDRDNSEVAKDFNEQDQAVLWAIEKTIKTCQKMGITSSICGQAPSDYPDLVMQLVHFGITSISVNPDAAEVTREVIYEAEKKLIEKRK